MPKTSGWVEIKDDLSDCAAVLNQDKGFDRVSQAWMWAVRRKLKVPRGLEHMVKNLDRRGTVGPQSLGKEAWQQLSQEWQRAVESTADHGR